MRMQVLLSLLAATALVLCASAVQCWVFTDDFSSGNLDKWEQVLPFGGSGMSVENGMMKVALDTGGWALALDAYGNRLICKDVIIEFDCYGGGGPGAAIHFGALSPNPDEDWRYTMYYEYWGVFPRLWIQSGDATGYVKYAQALNADDLDLTATHWTATYIDNWATLEVTDGLHTYFCEGPVGPEEGLQGPGAVGVRANGVAYFDNVVITCIPEPGSLLVLGTGLLALGGAIIRRRA